MIQTLCSCSLTSRNNGNVLGAVGFSLLCYSPFLFSISSFFILTFMLPALAVPELVNKEQDLAKSLVGVCVLESLVLVIPVERCRHQPETGVLDFSAKV